ncbi:MAG: hypothetical protein VX262_09360, partial [Acidobacteriota bacterium]|nr:hypothetical protein [Acidobacteriota bacterium]
MRLLTVGHVRVWHHVETLVNIRSLTCPERPFNGIHSLRCTSLDPHKTWMPLWLFPDIWTWIMA